MFNRDDAIPMNCKFLEDELVLITLDIICRPTYSADTEVG